MYVHPMKLVAASAAIGLSAGHASASEQNTGEIVTVTCAEWNTRYSSDPAVDHAADRTGHDPIILEQRGMRTEELVIPALPGVFDADVFDDQGAVSTHVTAIGADSLAYRLIGANWSDSLTFIRLDTETPQLNWQRLRTSEEGAAYETFYVANCTKG